VVAGLADRIAVMYAGRLVETGPAAEVIEAPAHPYTRGLVNSLPGLNARGSPLPAIPGTAPALGAANDGCTFAPRCARASPACRAVPPVFRLSDAHQHRCFHPLR
jgi:peptide/nickel transport system ATP-binding protein